MQVTVRRTAGAIGLRSGKSRSARAHAAFALQLNRARYPSSHHLRKLGERLCSSRWIFAVKHGYVHA
jgi:hypothetical protein